MKEGPNYADRNKIRVMFNEGLPVADISQRLNIKAPAVEVCLGGMGLLKKQRRRRQPAVQTQEEVSNG